MRRTVIAMLVAALAAPAGAAAPSRERIVIHGAGDTNFALGLNDAFADGEYQLAWSGLDGLFVADDLTIVNLECSPSLLGTLMVKQWSFRCPPAALGPMRAAGVEVASLANNHSLDLGRDALLDARANLLAAGIAPVGAGANLDEANAPALFEIGGWTVAVVAATRISGGGPWYADATTPGTAPLTRENITAALQAADARADIVIATVHWGVEGTFRPADKDRWLARIMVAAGADAIIGHHPHILHPLEYVDGVPVFWSMGNFVWTRHPLTDRNRTGLAEIVVEPDGSILARLVPAQIVADGHPVLRGFPDAQRRLGRHPAS